MTTDAHDAGKSAAVQALRDRIAAIEGSSKDIAGMAATAREQAKRDRVAPKKPPTFDGEGIPAGDGWLDLIPARCVDGERGFDLRLVRELVAVGLPARCLSDLGHGVSAMPTFPAAVPIYADWLQNLDEKIPGPETDHRRGIHAGLVVNLDDPAARGNRKAITALFAQLRRTPPVSFDPQYVTRALWRIAERKDYPEMVALLGEITDVSAKNWLIRYLGKFRTAEAKQILLSYLESHPAAAIESLVQMKATGVRQLIAAYVDDPSPNTRKWAKRAMERLPE